MKIIILVVPDSTEVLAHGRVATLTQVESSPNAQRLASNLMAAAKLAVSTYRQYLAEAPN